MSNLYDIIASAAAGQYFTALVVMFGVYWLLSVSGFKQKGAYRLFYKRPVSMRFSAAQILHCPVRQGLL